VRVDRMRRAVVVRVDQEDAVVGVRAGPKFASSSHVREGCWSRRGACCPGLMRMHLRVRNRDLRDDTGWSGSWMLNCMTLLRTSWRHRETDRRAEQHVGRIEKSGRLMTIEKL